VRELSEYFNDGNIVFSCGSYQDVVIKKRDFVYLDPPYYPCSSSSFTAYSAHPFLEEEQKKLLDFCVKLDTKNICFVQSNSPCKDVEKMYENFNKTSFHIGRQMRSGKGLSKNDANVDNEILIWNFPVLSFE
jgi:DNA adenine methylase